MSISAIILTFNESIHIERCIKSIQPLVDDVFVIDSFSTDNTVEIAKYLGAKIYQNSWINYATQFNWALENCSINTDWVWRIDADEYAEPELIKRLSNKLPLVGDEITGIYIKRGITFYGHKLQYGTWAPRWNLKIFRFNVGYCENRWMDEHIKLKYGKSIQIDGCQMDNNLNNFTWWTDKHNHYATREMVDMLSLKYNLGSQKEVEPKLLGTGEQRKRWMKLRYANIPLFIRPFLNFMYRYIFRLGFLDGKQGFLWHILQGFWYRFLVDAKIWEIKRRFKGNDNEIINYLKDKYKL